MSAIIDAFKGRDERLAEELKKFYDKRGLEALKNYVGMHIGINAENIEPYEKSFEKYISGFERFISLFKNNSEIDVKALGDLYKPSGTEHDTDNLTQKILNRMKRALGVSEQPSGTEHDTEHYTYNYHEILKSLEEDLEEMKFRKEVLDAIKNS